MNKIQQDFKLLPIIFKKVAFGIMIISLLLLILSISKILTIDKEIIKQISKTGLLISMLILAMTKNKVEDELILRIRLISFAASFIGGVGYAILYPYVKYLFNSNSFSDIGVTELLIFMLLTYFVNFYSRIKKGL